MEHTRQSTTRTEDRSTHPLTQQALDHPCEPTISVAAVQPADPDTAGPPEAGLPAASLLLALWRSFQRHHQIGVLDRQTRHFRNIPVTDAAAAVEQAVEASNAGNDTYFACGEYGSPDNRKAENVSGAWAFWMDFDCGPEKAAAGKGYRDTAEAELAISEFCKVTGLPEPTHSVHSGGGLHEYWVVDKAIDRETWQVHANKLKALTNACGFLADPSRTADIASVLRIPGTLNHKYSPPRPVTLVTAGPPIECETMLQAIRDAHDRLCPATVRPALLRPVNGASANDGALIATTGIATYGPPDIPRLSSALKCLDPDCDEATWKLNRLAPMARAAREHPECATEVESLARTWSSGELRGEPSTAWITPGASNGLTGAEAFDEEWSRFLRDDQGGQRTTLGTILHDAAEAGWRDLAEFEVVDTPAPIDAKTHLIQQANVTLEAMMVKVTAGDVGAPLELENVAALTVLCQHCQADYHRAKVAMKTANRRVSITAVDAAVKAGIAKTQTTPTHHGYATDLLAQLTVHGWQPVAHDGTLYVIDPETNIWVRKADGQLARLIAEAHDNGPNCKRNDDYAGIARHAVSLVSNEAFFAGAAVGVACPGGFHQIVGDQVLVEPLTPAHRQRVLLNITPCEQATPMFDDFLHQTFKSEREGEEAQQIFLLQEIAGAVMLGLMHRYQKAVLLHEPIGRAGKGTLVSVLSNLVPPAFVTAISPFKWDQDYHVVTLAGARLNVVGELPESKSIPAAAFKTVIGGDLISGRHPTHRPISFKNEAAHLFMSNHMITSNDHGEAFFTRWITVYFPNSLLVSGRQPDPKLATRIIENELPGIADWALQGATRLLQNGAFSPSAVHDRLMAKWRAGNSSLHEFIEESCDLGGDYSVRRSDLYKQYVAWCGDNGRKPFAKGRVKELLEHNIGLGISLAVLDGNEIFRGVKVKPDDEDALERAIARL